MIQETLSSIRADTCYPAFRGFVSFGAVIGYFVAGLVALSGVFALGAGSGGIIIALGLVIAAVVLTLLVKAVTECSLMLADIADCTVHNTASHRALIEQPAQPRRELTLDEMMRHVEQNNSAA